jgi:hypothetical protein
MAELRHRPVAVHHRVEHGDRRIGADAVALRQILNELLPVG